MYIHSVGFCIAYSNISVFSGPQTTDKQERKSAFFIIDTEKSPRLDMDLANAIYVLAGIFLCKNKCTMNQTSVSDCKVINIRKYTDNRGYLSVIEGGLDVPFEIKRIYYLYLVPEVARGAHAHKELQQLLIATSGSVDAIMDDGISKKTFHLDKPWKGLLIPAGLWRDLENFSGGAVLMCLASEKYNADDYIRNYNDFLKFKGL